MRQLVRVNIFLVFLLIVSSVTPAVNSFAAEQSETQPFRQRREFQGEEREERGHRPRHHGRQKNRAREMMMTLKIWKITEALDVDELLAEKLFPRVRELENLRFEQHQELMELTRDLRGLLKKIDQDMDRIHSLSVHITNLKVEHAIAEREKLEAIFEVLSTEQQASFLLMEAEFHQKMSRFIRDRKRHPGKSPDIPDIPESSKQDAP
jgi:hypothetical protein